MLVNAVAGRVQPAEAAEELPNAEPDGNINPDQARDFLQRVIDGMDLLRPRLIESARERGEVLLDAHRRVRQASKARGISHRIEAQDEPDVLGIFVYLPKA